jgi:hypothetical protein
MDRDLVQSVDRGARWLDEHRPGWASLVDTDALNMISATRCVAGQVFTERTKARYRGRQFLTGYHAMTTLAADSGIAGRVDHVLGFTHPDFRLYFGEADSPGLIALRDLWIAQVKMRVTEESNA